MSVRFLLTLNSAGLQTEFIHDRRPFGDIALDHVGEVLWRAAQWLIAEFGERGLELQFQASVDLEIELVDHLARGVRRRQQPGPTRRDEAGEAALRQVGRSGSSGMRLELVVASARSLPLWISGNSTLVSSKVICTWPATRSLMEGPLPR